MCRCASVLVLTHSALVRRHNGTLTALITPHSVPAALPGLGLAAVGSNGYLTAISGLAAVGGICAALVSRAKTGKWSVGRAVREPLECSSRARGQARAAHPPP